MCLGQYLPSCDEAGYYRAHQCHSSSNQCWCVDRYGNEIAGSRARGATNCGRQKHAQNLEPRSEGCRVMSGLLRVAMPTRGLSSVDIQLDEALEVSMWRLRTSRGFFVFTQG